MTRLDHWTHQSFQSEIVRLAHLNHWTTQYFWRNFHSPKGWLDLVLVKPESNRLIFAELKIPPDKVTSEQQMWIDIWSQYPMVEVYVWTPKDWEDIIKLLSSDNNIRHTVIP